MRITSGIQFYCRNSKKNKDGLAPVEVSIIICGDRKFICLPFKCDPNDFNRKRRPKYIQDYIDSQRVRLATAMSELATNGQPVTPETIKTYVKTGGIPSYTIETLFEDYLRLVKQRVGKTLTESVYNKYELVRYLFFEHIDKSSECTVITPAVVQEFYIKLQAKYQDSTSCGYMTKLKSVIRYGIDNNHIKINPFQNIKINKGTKEIETITLAQLNAIINHQFIQRVQRVADLFIFACGSGLAYCDVMALKPEDFVMKDGKLCIFKERKKTGVKFYSVLLPWAVAIYNKYNGELPKLSNQKVNQYLDEVAGVCGIDNLHFHLARHFYGMYALNHNIPATSVQKMMGHKNLAQTMHYAKALETTVIDDFERAFG